MRTAWTRDRFGERAFADDPEIDVVVGQRIAPHHVPQEALRGVLPFVEEVDVGLVTAEPVTDEHVAPEELAEPEVAHAQAAAGGAVVGAMARAAGRGAPSAAEVTTVRPSTKSPIDQMRLDARAIPARCERVGGAGVAHHHGCAERAGHRDGGVVPVAFDRHHPVAVGAEQGDGGGADVPEPAHDHVSPRPVAGGHPVELVTEEAGGEAHRREQGHDGGEEAGDLQGHRDRLPRSGRRHEVQGEEEERVVDGRRRRHPAGPEVADDTQRERHDPDDDRHDGRARRPRRNPRTAERLHAPSS